MTGFWIGFGLIAMFAALYGVWAMRHGGDNPDLFDDWHEDRPHMPNEYD